MTSKEKKALLTYVRMIADRMGLRDWRFDVLEQEPETGKEYEGTNFQASASCEPTPNQRRASLRFADDFSSKSRDEARHILVHELLHCHMAAVYECGRNGVLDQLSQSTYNMFMFSFTQAWETAIDAIAIAWAEKLPLPKFPK